MKYLPHRVEFVGAGRKSSSKIGLIYGRRCTELMYRWNYSIDSSFYAIQQIHWAGPVLNCDSNLWRISVQNPTFTEYQKINYFCLHPSGALFCFCILKQVIVSYQWLLRMQLLIQLATDTCTSQSLEKQGNYRCAFDLHMVCDGKKVYRLHRSPINQCKEQSSSRGKKKTQFTKVRNHFRG